MSIPAAGSAKRAAAAAVLCLTPEGVNRAQQHRISSTNQHAINIIRWKGRVTHFVRMGRVELKRVEIEPQNREY